MPDIDTLHARHIPEFDPVLLRSNLLCAPGTIGALAVPAGLKELIPVIPYKFQAESYRTRHHPWHAATYTFATTRASRQIAKHFPDLEQPVNDVMEQFIATIDDSGLLPKKLGNIAAVIGAGDVLLNKKPDVPMQDFYRQHNWHRDPPGTVFTATAIGAGFQYINQPPPVNRLGVPLGQKAQVAKVTPADITTMEPTHVLAFPSVLLHRWGVEPVETSQPRLALSVLVTSAC